MKKFIVFLALYTSTLFAFSDTPSEEIAHFTVLSVPKGGSHLLHKAIHRMTGKKPELLGEETDVNKCVPSDATYPWKYLALPDNELKACLKNKKLKKIILVRDLRDVTISHIMHIENQFPGTWLPANEEALYHAQSFDKKLIYFMVQNKHHRTSPRRIASQALKFSSTIKNYIDKDTLVCRFENLIGPQGGGNSTLQKRELEKIAQFLNVSLTPCEIEKIAETLFGIDELLDYKWKKQYYRAGRVEGWKTFFTPNVMEYYTQNLAYLNEKLGYK